MTALASSLGVDDFIAQVIVTLAAGWMVLHMFRAGQTRACARCPAPRFRPTTAGRGIRSPRLRVLCGD